MPPSLSTFGLTTLLLGGAFSKECVLKDVGRRLPWAPGWSFKLKDCTVLSLSDAGLSDEGKTRREGEDLPYLPVMRAERKKYLDSSYILHIPVGGL